MSVILLQDFLEHIVIWWITIHFWLIFLKLKKKNGRKFPKHVDVDKRDFIFSDINKIYISYMHPSFVSLLLILVEVRLSTVCFCPRNSALGGENYWVKLIVLSLLFDCKISGSQYYLTILLNFHSIFTLLLCEIPTAYLFLSSQTSSLFT